MSRARRFGPVLLLGALSVGWPIAGRSDEPSRASSALAGQVGAGVGQLFSFDLNFPAAFPLLELRAGYQVSEQFLVRLTVGAAFSKVAHAAQPAFEGAWLLTGTGSLDLLWTPRLGADWVLELGPSIAPCFTALWGRDPPGGVGYQEDTVFGYGALVGLEWELGSRWALQLEVRYRWSPGGLAGEGFNLDGLGVVIGFVRRLRPFDVGQHD